MLGLPLPQRPNRITASKDLKLTTKQKFLLKLSQVKKVTKSKFIDLYKKTYKHRYKIGAALLAAAAIAWLRYNSSNTKKYEGFMPSITPDEESLSELNQAQEDPHQVDDGLDEELLGFDSEPQGDMINSHQSSSVRNYDILDKKYN